MFVVCLLLAIVCFVVVLCCVLCVIGIFIQKAVLARPKTADIGWLVIMESLKWQVHVCVHVFLCVRRFLGFVVVF